MFNAENNTLKLPCGADMYYAKFGKGKQNLVMIPGLNIVDMDGTAANLAYFYRKFTSEFTVYIFDRRSGRDENATIKSMSDDLYDAIHTLGIGEAYFLGVSQGGMIAQYLAAEHPGLVKKLVLGVTASSTNPTMLEALGEWIKTAEKGDLKGVFTKSYDRMYTPKQMKLYRLIIPVIMKFTKFMSIERFEDHAKAILSLDSSHLLNNITCPSLVIGAEMDRVTTPQASWEIAETLGCRCHIFKGEGHAVYLNSAFNRMVYDFFTDKTDQEKKH